jgi:hypothetical protein
MPLLLDGSTKYLTLANESYYDFERTQPFTLTAWARRSGTADSAIVSKIDGSGAGLRGWEFGQVTSGQLRLRLENDSSIPNEIYVRSTNVVLTLDVWAHVAATYDGSSTAAGCILYVNGATVPMTTVFDGLSATILDDVSVLIGARPGPALFWTGSLGRVMIFSTALSGPQIAALASPENAPPWEVVRYENIKSHFPLVETTATINDRIGGGPVATVTGSPAQTDGPGDDPSFIISRARRPPMSLRGPSRDTIAGTKLLCGGQRRTDPTEEVFAGWDIDFVVGSGQAGQIFTVALAGAVTPAGALTNLTAKQLGGGATPTGVLAKLIGKPLAGAATPTGTLAKLIGKPLAGGITPTGLLALVKVVLLSLAGSITPTGTLAKQVQKSLAGTVTPTGTLVRLVGKALSSGVTPTGALAKLIAKPLAGGVTPTGTLTKIKVALISLAGGITPTGTLRKQVNKQLAGGATPTGSITRLVAKQLAGTIVPAGMLRKAISKVFGGLIAPVGTLIRSLLGATEPAVVLLSDRSFTDVLLTDSPLADVLASDAAFTSVVLGDSTP